MKHKKNTELMIGTGFFFILLFLGSYFSSVSGKNGISNALSNTEFRQFSNHQDHKN